VIRRTLAKLARMDAGELRWRGATAARTLVDRGRHRMMASRWARKDLLPRLVPSRELSTVAEHLSAQRWDAAHLALVRHFGRGPRRLPVGPHSKHALIARIHREFPGAARHAALRADPILAGEYDLLGYRGLRFGRFTPGRTALPDWSLDPVNNRRPPHAFWSSVPYLDASCGDHKIIWELNRHQHWLVLGRAFWLTGERRYRERVLAELASWLRSNPPLTGVNWSSMLEVALRSLSWLWAIQLFVEAPDDSEDDRLRADASPWLVDLLLGLDRQLAHVERNLSHYFSPNTHLLGEALALYVIGRALPELAASRRRASIGRTILCQQIDRQIAADGGHCERSTHYHRYALDFYTLALIAARESGDLEAAPVFADAVTRMAFAARLLADDNGRVPHIGDDDGGALLPILGRDPDDVRASLAAASSLVDRPDLRIGDAPEDALWMLGDAPGVAKPQPDAPVASASLPDTGYYVSRSAAGDHLLIDGGPHGFQNGGHAHADALSLTLAVRGVPLLIDPGTACYTTDPALRDRLRSTALHNTLVVDGQSQSLPAGPFHWSHVANGRVHRWRTHPAFDYFDGSHDGYRPIEHRRRVLSVHGDLVVVADFVAGSGAHAAAVHWHVDPRWSVETRARGAVFTRSANRADRVGLSVPEGVIDHFSGDDLTGLGWCSPAYGRIDRATTVRIAHNATSPFWMVTVFDLDGDNEVVGVDWVPVWAEAGAVDHGTAIRISRAASVDHVLFVQDRADTRVRPDERGTLFSGRKPLWRVGDVETDARMLMVRASVGRPLACVASVDATTARTRNLELLNPAPIVKASSCAALPVS
jgi:hypothetical protein